MASQTEQRCKLLRVVVAIGRFSQELQSLVTRLTPDILDETWEAAGGLARAGCSEMNENADILTCWCAKWEMERIAICRKVFFKRLAGNTEKLYDHLEIY